LAVLAVAAVALIVPVTMSGAAIVVPEPVGPFGYTNGSKALGGFEDCSFYKVALGNGVAVEVGTELDCVDGLTFSPAGVLYGYTLMLLKGVPVAQSALVTIDTTTGAQTVVGPMGRGFYEGGMTFDKDGKLWLYSEPNDTSCGEGFNCLFSVDPATGATTVVGGPGVRAFLPTGLAADCTTVYATGTVATGVDGDSLYTVDTATGAVTSVGNIGLPIFTAGLDFAGDGTLYTIGEPWVNGPFPYAPKSATVDKATGAGSNPQTWVTNDTTPTAIRGLAIAGLSCAAPEPPPVVQPTFTG
jgi:sugar lactone lactonase YvrE